MAFVPVLLALALMLLGGRAAYAGPYLVFDARSGAVLAEQDAFEPWYPASLTKLMTAYVTFRAIGAREIALDGAVVMSKAASKEPPSKMGFKPGTVITVDTALKLLIVKSANDVAMALAESVAGSEAAFVQRMNAEAARLGMVSTRFINANGLPGDGQQTTARDLALLARAIIVDYPEYRELFRITGLALGGKVIKTHNHLLERYPGTDGMKTGFICASGFNVVASAQRGNRRLVAVVLGEMSAMERAEHTAELFEGAFQSSGSGFFSKSVTLETLRPRRTPSAYPANIREDVCGKNRNQGEDASATIVQAGVAAEPPKTFLVPRFELMEPVPISLGGAAGALAAAVEVDGVPLPRPKPGDLSALEPMPAAATAAVPTTVAPAAFAAPDPALDALPPLEGPPIEILGLKGGN